MKKHSGCCSKTGSGHMKWMLLLVVAGLALSFFVPAASGWILLLFLLCPLLMIGMMSMKGPGHQQKEDTSAKATESTETPTDQNEKGSCH